MVFLVFQAFLVFMDFLSLRCQWFVVSSWRAWFYGSACRRVFMVFLTPRLHVFRELGNPEKPGQPRTQRTAGTLGKPKELVKPENHKTNKIMNTDEIRRTRHVHRGRLNGVEPLRESHSSADRHCPSRDVKVVLHKGLNT